MYALPSRARVVVDLDAALWWGRIAELQDPLGVQSRPRRVRAGETSLVRCATANVLTLHPAEERAELLGGARREHPPCSIRKLIPYR